MRRRLSRSHGRQRHARCASAREPPWSIRFRNDNRTPRCRVFDRSRCHDRAMTPNPVPDGFVPLTRRTPFLDLVGPLWVRDKDGDLDPVYGLRIENRHANGRGGAPRRNPDDHDRSGSWLHGRVQQGTAGQAHHREYEHRLCRLSEDRRLGRGSSRYSTHRRHAGFRERYFSVGDRRILRASSVFAVTT
jgi:hypothetical protein